MGFLSDLFSGLAPSSFGDILELGGTAASIFQAFNTPDVPSGVKQAARQQGAIVSALLDESDPMFADLAGREERKLRADFGQILGALSTANNRAVARTGGVGFFSPERRDETLNSLIRTNDFKEQARYNARQYLQMAAGINAGGAALYQPAIDAATARYNASFAGFGGLSDVGRYFAGRTTMSGAPLDGSSNQTITIKLPPQATNGGNGLPAIYGS